MLKLLKHLKNHMIPIIGIVALLVIQAVCDLALPQYTSNIVDIGISSGGIESGLPSVIRESQLGKLMLFMSDEDKNEMNQAYLTVKEPNYSQADIEKYEKKYPIAKESSICLLQKAKKETKAKWEKILIQPIMMVNFLNSDSDESKQMKEDLLSRMMSQMPEGVSMADVDIFDVLSQMPLEQRLEMGNKMTENADIPESYMSKMTNAFIKAEYEAIGIDISQIQTSYLIWSGLKMLGVAFIAMIATVLVCLLAARVAGKLGMELRTKVFKKVVSFSNTEMDHFSTASLITRSTNDVQQIQMVVVMILRMVLYAPILGIGGIIKVMNTNLSMSWIIAVAVAAILCLVLILFKVAMPKFKIMQTLVDKVNLVTREILTGLPVIRAFSTEKHEEERFDKANKELTRTMLFTNRAMTFMMPIMMLIMNGVAVMIIWFGGKGVDAGNLQVGDMMAFMTYTMQIVMSFLMITMISIMLPRAAVAAGRIDEVLNTELVIRDSDKNTTLESRQSETVEFDHVSFRYPNAEEDVLEDIHFTAKSGQTTAIIGSTGSGKSTLVNLIPRFYDVTKGSIRIGGIDIKEMSQEYLRDQLGYVPQKGILFSGTIATNLRFGKEEATEEEIKKAAKIAQASDFINERPDGYETPISQGGSNVSGGQKQRLSIARAIAKEPRVYIFDDSFSALDFKTDVVLRRALKEETRGATVFIVAQRVSTIMNAEQIIVLDDGKIAGIGTHAKLLANNEVYQQIAMSQLSKEELDRGGMAHE